MDNQLLYAILTSSAVGTVVGTIIGIIKDFFRSKKIDRIVLLFIIKTLGTEALFEGGISNEDLQSLEDAYTEYKALHGNGYADTIMRKVRVLPLKEE